jgi:pyruvate,water dikinase
MGASRPDWHWTTTNAGEALPGVMTPLMWTFWGPSTEHGARESAYQVGALTAAERAVPADPAQWYAQAFHGRVALRLDYLALLGDRLPGTTGRDAVFNFVGTVPEGLTFAPTRRRYPIIAARLPVLFARFPSRIATLAGSVEAWWQATTPVVPTLSLPACRAAFTEARRRHDEAMVGQTNGIVSNMQPLYAAVADLTAKTGSPDLSILTGASGGAEMAVVLDVWRASRGELTVEDVVARHGFHGPNEGELSSTVWREDDAPLRRLVAQYAGRGDDEDPRRREAARAQRHAQAERDLLAALPAARRPGARLLLKLARERLPLRGVGKRAFLQANDVGRATARRLGELLAEAGELAEPGDVFFLTAPELSAPALPPDVAERVARRRAERAAYLEVTVPEKWQGLPVTVPLAHDGERAAEEDGPVVLSGLGVSSGVVEGTVRVVTDPSFVDVEPDEILVAPVTDPSWSAIMFISSALVVDIGGALSHAAVVARELDIPCVVGTHDGTARLRTGDRVRVDGTAGTVELLERPA